MWQRKTKYRCRRYLFLIAALIGLSPLSLFTSAEVTLDGSLGPAGSLTGPDFQIPAEVGRQAGYNLFHSFGQFNLASAESATFSGPVSIENILGRVTGGNASSIDGLVRSTIPQANLFLLNPAGILFGPNAQLDVQGSFHAGTADFIGLADGVRFNAVPSADDAILTTAPPAAFGFLDEDPAPITVAGSQLEVVERETLSLVGGELTIRNGQLRAPGGQLQLASAASPGEVGLTESGLETGPLAQRGDITVSDSALLVGFFGESAGDVHIVGGKFELVASSTVAVAGNITIRADELQLEDGFITAESFRGRSGNVKIEVQGLVNLVRSQISTGVSEGAGDAGSISIAEPVALVLLEGSRIQANAGGTGDAGSVLILAGRLEVRDFGDISSSTEGSGEGGEVTISATNIDLNNGGSISAESQSTNPDAGESGNISIYADDSFRLFDGSRVSVETARANAGNIELDVGFLLHLRDRSEVTTSVAGGQSDGGNIIIDPVFVVLDGASVIFANARNGDVNVTTDFLFQSPDSRVEASSSFSFVGVVDTDVVNPHVELPAGFLDWARVLTKRCAQRSGADVVRLVARRYEVLPDSPYALRVRLPETVTDASKPSAEGNTASTGNLLALELSCPDDG